MGAIPTLRLIQKAGIPDYRRVRWPAHRTGQQWLDVPQQRIIGRKPDGIPETLGYLPGIPKRRGGCGCWC